MPEIKLPQLPDWTPVKLTPSVMTDLHQALIDYAALYSRACGRDEPVAKLIPAMLATFLDSDRGFSRGRAGGR